MAEPILSVAEMRAREERTWASGVSQDSVIRRAGLAVARTARRMTQAGDPVLVLSGRGHNGDDAAVAAEALSDRTITRLRLGDGSGFEQALAWLERHRGQREALVIDGLFGIGLNRPLEGEWARLVLGLNESGIRVLSVDVPSGMDAETGSCLGVGVRATRTVTLGSVKRGLIGEAAAAQVGRLELAYDIGLAPTAGDSSLGMWWTVPELDFRGLPPARPEGGHKGTFGHVVVVAGSSGFHGAAVLSARGALRARPGLVSVVTEACCTVPVASQLQSAMVRAWGGERLDADGISALVIGPGLASPTLPPSFRGEVVRVWREAACPVVADASALDWLPAGGSCAGVRVVTPHPGEAARLLGVTPAVIQEDRQGAVLRLLERWSGVRLWVVLKGRLTVVAGPDRRRFLNPSGNPGMAQGGSGDVLAGYLGGLLARRELAADPGLAVRYGVWRHGATADELEARWDGWTVEDLVEALRERPRDLD